MRPQGARVEAPRHHHPEKSHRMSSKRSAEKSAMLYLIHRERRGGWPLEYGLVNRAHLGA